MLYHRIILHGVAELSRWCVHHHVHWSGRRKVLMCSRFDHECSCGYILNLRRPTPSIVACTCLALRLQLLWVLILLILLTGWLLLVLMMIIVIIILMTTTTLQIILLLLLFRGARAFLRWVPNRLVTCRCWAGDWRFITWRELICSTALVDSDEKVCVIGNAVWEHNEAVVCIINTKL